MNIKSRFGLGLLASAATSLLLLTFGSVSLGVAAGVSIPTVQVSVGDSITRGFNANRNCFLKDCPTLSWSTGTDSTVNSHYKRFSTAPSSYLNYAKTGAKVADLGAQLAQASTAGADYVTILIGANDACTPSVSTMTTTASFKASFEAALSTYFSSANSGYVYVSSIPNVRSLYNLFAKNSTAKSTWSLYRICQSMLGSKVTETQRGQVLARIVEFNSVMATACAQYSSKCKWDGNAVFNTSFSTTDISTLDYFHPSLAGQQKLAQVTWQTSYWAVS